MRDGTEGECEESCSIIPVDTSFTFDQYSVCPQSSSLSTDHMRKHDDSTHASAWLKVTLKRDICCTRVRSTLLNVCHFGRHGILRVISIIKCPSFWAARVS